MDDRFQAEAVAELPRVVLEKLQIVVAESITPEFAASMKLSQNYSPVMNYIMLQLRALILAEKLAEDIQEQKYEVPRSWWQHLKLTYRHHWWFRWFVNWRPVQYKTIVFMVRWNRYATRPMARIPVNDHFGPIIYREGVGSWIEERES